MARLCVMGCACGDGSRVLLVVCAVWWGCFMCVSDPGCGSPVGSTWQHEGTWGVVLRPVVFHVAHHWRRTSDSLAPTRHENCTACSARDRVFTVPLGVRLCLAAGGELLHVKGILTAVHCRCVRPASRHGGAVGAQCQRQLPVPHRRHDGGDASRQGRPVCGGSDAV